MAMATSALTVAHPDIASVSGSSAETWGDAQSTWKPGRAGAAPTRREDG